MISKFYSNNSFKLNRGVKFLWNKLVKIALFLILITIQFSLNIVNSLNTNLNIYRIEGEYQGTYKLEISGIYKTIFTRNYSDYKSGYLKINYNIYFNLNIIFNNYEYYFLYIYYLYNYSIDYLNIPFNIVNNINNTLRNQLNKTIIQYSKIVDPSILLNISIEDNYTIYFHRLGEQRQINGISIYGDSVCFEHVMYREEINEATIYRYVNRAIYETISYTPFYIYRYDTYFDTVNETNYLRIILELIEIDISRDLSRISRTKTYYIHFQNGLTSRIGLISYGDTDIELIHNNNSLIIEVKKHTPYRLIMINSNGIEIEQHSVELFNVYLKPFIIQYTPVLLYDNLINIVFNNNISKFSISRSNPLVSYDITVQEKQYSSTNIILFTLFINGIALYLLYRFCKYISKIVIEALK